MEDDDNDDATERNYIEADYKNCKVILFENLVSVAYCTHMFQSHIAFLPFRLPVLLTA
jgi:hypothetical protein